MFTRIYRCLIINIGVVAAAYIALSSGEAATVADRTPPPAQSPGQVLIDRHDCWTGEAPADVWIPGHVVWQHPDGSVVYSTRLVGPALESLEGSVKLPGQPLGFCR